MHVEIELAEETVVVRVSEVHPVNSDTARDIAAELALRMHRELSHCGE